MDDIKVPFVKDVTVKEIGTTSMCTDFNSLKVHTLLLMSRALKAPMKIGIMAISYEQRIVWQGLFQEPLRNKGMGRVILSSSRVLLQGSWTSTYDVVHYDSVGNTLLCDNC